MAGFESLAATMTRALSLLVAAMAVLAAVQVSSGGGPGAPGPCAPPEQAQQDTKAQIDSLLLGITSAMMERNVQELQDFKTRYSYRGDKCLQVTDMIASRFSANGLSVAFSDFTYQDYSMRNVIGQKTGVTRPGDIFIICAHYDSISPAAWSHAPGADDNASGTAAVLAAAEILSDYDLNCTVRFIAFGGEEQGLRGSANYFGQVVGLGENICGVINLDMIAYNPGAGGAANVYVAKDFGDVRAVAGEHVYGPAPAGDTTVMMHLDHEGILDCSLYLEEQGSPGVKRKLAQGTDYALNATSGEIDLSSGIGPLLEFENLTGWYNYSPAASLINYMKGVMLRYSNVFNLQPFDLQSASSDHAPFSPMYPAMMLIEQGYGGNPNYHKVTDTTDYLNFTFCANVTQAAVAMLAELSGIGPADNSPPAHTPGHPRGGSASVAVPSISIEITDPSLPSAASAAMFVNGVRVAPLITPISLGFNMSYSPPGPFPDGAGVNVSVWAEDAHGNWLNHSWQFAVDATPPEPPANLTIAKARIEAAKRGKAVDLGATFDSRHAFSPTVISRDGLYHMYYSANDGSKWTICRATSANGLAWTKHGIVLSPGTVGQPDSTYAAHPSVIYDGEYKMWYTGFNGVNMRVMYANSTDGQTWVKRGVALDVGGPGSLDAKWALHPCVVRTGEYEMWYTGFDGWQYRILYANSSDGLSWTRLGEDITPAGAGVLSGDAYTWSPEVVLVGGKFHMYHTRYDGLYARTVLSTSDDGMRWTELGMAVDVGPSLSADMYRAEQCSIMASGAETKVWYSAYNNSNWRIMFANLTGSDARNDLVLSWSPSASADVVRYEVFRESRPSAFGRGLAATTPEFYIPPAGQTPWAFEREAVENATVHTSAGAAAPQWFYMPDDNMVDAALCIRAPTGAWSRLAEGADYNLDLESGHVEVYTPLLESGSTLHAWYNHSAGRALRTTGTGVADVGAGLGSDRSYYYVVRAVDRAGNAAECRESVAKMATPLPETWNLVGAPLLGWEANLTDALEGVEWAHARTWEPGRQPNHWTSNRPGSGFNSLFTVGGGAGLWVKTAAPGTQVTVGTVANLTINLTAGWNLVAYPYHEAQSAAESLAGVPWDMADVMDTGFPGMLCPVFPQDMLFPGRGMWVHVTSDCVWNAVNSP